MKVVIAAAGTGGHINPGIAIANKIMEKEPQSKIIFIGTGRGLEKDLVPRAGYELKTVEAYGINRKVNLDNIKRLCKTIKAVGQAKKILKEFKPDIVIGTGGYICVSVCMAASQLKIPIVLHESNAFPGVAVKVMAKKADEILLGFEEAKERISNARKIVVTGTPTKVNSNRLSDEQKYNLKQEMKLKQDLPVILFFGGSQGAQSINNAILGIIENRLNEKYQIVWAVGPGNYDEVKEKLRIKNIDIEQLKSYGVYDRDPRTRVITTAYVALVPDGMIEAHAGDDAKDAEWFDIAWQSRGVKENNGISTEELQLELKCKDISVGATVVRTMYTDSILKAPDYRLIQSNGLAADHGAIIMEAVDYVKDKL